MYWECSEEERSNWETLIKCLKDKFSPESSRASFEAAFENRKKRDSESLDKFLIELRALGRKAYPDWSDTYRDKLVRRCFIDGIDDQLRIWVLQANPKASDEALQVALRSESNLKKAQPPKVEVAAASACQPTGTSELATAIAEALRMTGVTPMTRYGNNFRGRCRGAPRGGRGRGTGNQGPCYACGERGHFWRDTRCPRSPANASNQENGRGAGMF